MRTCHDGEWVLEELDESRSEQVLPGGLRYLWTGAFGVVLCVSLSVELEEDKYRYEAVVLVDEVYRVLGRENGVRTGAAEDRDGQYLHCLAMRCLVRLGSL